jgi:RNA polymerase sigma-70 factor (ECF subfamily)
MTTADFESIVRAQQGMVYSIAYHCFRNVALAEEVAQEVFLQLFEHRQVVNPDQHVVAWLRRVTAHRCIDRARQQSMYREVALDDVGEIPAARHDDDPMLRARLQRLVASLPPTQRVVVILRYSEDLEVGDIARTLQMPASTVASHLRRALLLLRAKASRYVMQVAHEHVR